MKRMIDNKKLKFQSGCMEYTHTQFIAQFLRYAFYVESTLLTLI